MMKGVQPTRVAAPLLALLTALSFLRTLLGQPLPVPYGAPAPAPSTTTTALPSSVNQDKYYIISSLMLNVSDYLHPGELPGNATVPSFNITYRLIGQRSNLLPLSASNISFWTDKMYGRAFGVGGIQKVVITTIESPEIPRTVRAPGNGRRLLTTPAAAAGGRRQLLQQYAPEGAPPPSALLPLSVDDLESDYASVDVTVQTTVNSSSNICALGLEPSYHNVWSAQLATYGYQIQMLTLDMVFDPRVVPIYSRMDIKPIAATQVTLQLRGPFVLPFDLARQNALMLELYTRLSSKAAAQYIKTISVVEAPDSQDSSSGSVNVTLIVQHMALSASSLTVGQALTTDVLYRSYQGSADLTASLAQDGLVADLTVLNATELGNYTVYDQLQAFRTLSATANQTANQASSDAGLSKGGIAGLAVGAAAVCLLVLAAGFALPRALKARRAAASIPLHEQQLRRDSEKRTSSSSSEADAELAPKLALARLDVWNANANSHQHSWSVPYASAMPRSVSEKIRCWEVNPDDIVPVLDSTTGEPICLGQGGYGKVYRALYGVNDVAVKILLTHDGLTLQSLEHFKREMTLLKTLSYNANVVQFIGMSAHGSLPMLVMELCLGGNLRHALSNPDIQAQMRWYAKGKCIALDACKAIAFLHKHNIVHRDIKAANLLLDETCSHAKLGDVGLAHMIEDTVSSQLRGTLAYLAPEVLLDQRVDLTSDIYSLGVLLWEIATQDIPWRGGLRPLQVPEEAPAEVATAIERCLAPADSRPTAEEVYWMLAGPESSQ